MRSAHGFARAGGAILLLSALLIVASTHIAGAAITLLATSDNEGHIGPCRSCPAMVGLGGIDRHATYLAAERARNPSVALVDAGNWLFGPDSLSSEGRIMATAYGALKYDAVNLSYRDFRLGKTVTLQRLQEATFPVVSANVVDTATGELLAKPFVVRKIGDHQIAFLGVCEIPAGIESLPHLKDQLADIRITSPLDAIAATLPKIKGEADGAVLLYYGSPIGLQKILETHGREFQAVVMGGARPFELPEKHIPPILSAEMHGNSIGRLDLANGRGRAEQILIGPQIAADPAMHSLLEASIGAEPPQRSGEPRVPREQCATDDEDAVPLKPRAQGPARGLEGVGLTAQQVNAAIDKGCIGLWAVLKKEMAEEQVEFGAKREHILCALALVHGDFHKKNAEFNSTLRGYLSSVELTPDFGIYRTGILCMLIEGYGEPSYEPKLRKAARWLLESQMNTGTWSYTPEVPDSVFAPAAAPTGAIQISGGLPPGKRAEPWKRVTPATEGDGDNSVTQYGLLGMLSATRAGIRFDDAMWKLVMKTTREREDDDGGWAYSDKSSSYGSMTCAGICALAICRHELGEKDPADDPAIQHGLAWLDKYFKASEHPIDRKEWYFYYMYSLERVGRILDTEFIGVNEWYPLGAAALIGQQKQDGTWAAQEGDEMDPRLSSSFALLFLTRATPPLKPEVHTGPGTLRTAAIAPNNQFYIILDASGSMITMMDGKRKFDIARDSIRSLIAQLPSNCDVALRVYGHRKTALDEGADEDTELNIPMGKLDKKQFNAVLDSLRPRGRTPLALSLDQAAADLGEITAAHPITVLLLTDGGEDTINPRGNPIKAATDFGKIPNIRFHIVGFDINQPDWNAQLQNMAKVSHASYWPAAKGSELERTVRTAVLGLPDEYVVLNDSGKEIARGRFGQPQQLAEGHYKFQAKFAGRDISDEFWINAGEPTDITFDASQLPPAKQ